MQSKVPLLAGVLHLAGQVAMLPWLVPWPRCVPWWFIPLVRAEGEHHFPTLLHQEFQIGHGGRIYTTEIGMSYQSRSWWLNIYQHEERGVGRQKHSPCPAPWGAREWEWATFSHSDKAAICSQLYPPPRGYISWRRYLLLIYAKATNGPVATLSSEQWFPNLDDHHHHIIILLEMDFRDFQGFLIGQSKHVASNNGFLPALLPNWQTPVLIGCSLNQGEIFLSLLAGVNRKWYKPIRMIPSPSPSLFVGICVGIWPSCGYLCEANHVKYVGLIAWDYICFDASEQDPKFEKET